MAMICHDLFCSTDFFRALHLEKRNDQIMTIFDIIARRNACKSWKSSGGTAPVQEDAFNHMESNSFALDDERPFRIMRSMANQRRFALLLSVPRLQRRGVSVFLHECGCYDAKSPKRSSNMAAPVRPHRGARNGSLPAAPSPASFTGRAANISGGEIIIRSIARHARPIQRPGRRVCRATGSIPEYRPVLCFPYVL